MEARIAFALLVLVGGCKSDSASSASTPANPPSVSMPAQPTPAAEDWQKNIEWSASNGDSPNALQGRCPTVAALAGVDSAKVFTLSRSKIITMAKELARNGQETAAWGYACATQCHNPSAMDTLINNRGKVIRWLQTN